MEIAYITEINDKNYKNILQNNKLVVVDVWAGWCGPCLQLSPILDSVASELGDKVLIGKLDADSNTEFITETGVRNLPTILVYKDGKIVDKQVGVIPKQKLKDFISKHID